MTGPRGLKALNSLYVSAVRAIAVVSSFLLIIYCSFLFFILLSFILFFNWCIAIVRLPFIQGCFAGYVAKVTWAVSEYYMFALLLAIVTD
jgi:hypothetical protein